MNPHARSHLFVLLSFVIISIIVTWPLVLKLTDGIPYGGDGFQYIWNGWWFSKAVHDPDLFLMFTPYQYSPVGSSLVLHDFEPLNAFIQSILRNFTGDFAAYNILILAHYILGAWGAYILAYYFTGDRAASVVAGIIYGFSAHHAMHLSQLGTVSSGFLPLGVYYLSKFTRDGLWRDGVLAVLVITGAALTHWYNYVFIAVVFFGLFLIGQISLKEHFGGLSRWLRAFVPWAVSILILLPLVVDTVSELGRHDTSWEIGMGSLYVLNPLLLVIPSPDHPILGGIGAHFENFIPGNHTEGVVTIGIIAAVLGLMSWRAKDSTSRSWCILGLILFLLALGPQIWHTSIPGPFRIWSMIPGLNLLRIPARFVGPFTLAAAMSVAGYLSGAIRFKRSDGFRKIVLYAIPAMVIFETLVIPVPISGKEFIHPKLTEIKNIYMDATGSGSPPDLMVNFPLLPARRHFLLQQTLHEIPTFDGALSYPPPGAMDFFLDFSWSPESLRNGGIDLILYQPWAASTRLGETFLIPQNASGRARQWAGQNVNPLVFLRDVMGYAIIYEDDEMVLFLVPDT